MDEEYRRNFKEELNHILMGSYAVSGVQITVDDSFIKTMNDATKIPIIARILQNLVQNEIKNRLK